ncbi:ABC transporter permease [Chlamydiota bacterium]
MKIMYVLASLVVKEQLRRKLMFFSVAVTCFIIFFSKTFTGLTPGAEKKFMLDISYTWITLIGILLVLISATDVISGEEREDTNYYYKTNPVSYFALIGGKYLGSVGIILLSVSLIQLFFLTFFWIHFDAFSVEYIKGFLLIDMQLMMLVGIALFSSCLFSRFTSILFCISIYLIGILDSYVLHLAAHQHHSHREVSSFSDKIALFFYKILPNFERFDLSEDIILGIPIRMQVVWGAGIYAIIIISVFLLLAIIFLKWKSDLK